MRLIDELRAEHELIEAVAGSLRTFVTERCTGTGDAADGARFVEFLREYAGHYHHAREEEALFAALLERTELPRQGPIAVLEADHRRIAGLLDQIAAIIGGECPDDDACRRLDDLAVRYSRSLWSHIDAENSVLFPESESRLRKAGVRELASRPITPREVAAKEAGHDLVRRYPPAYDAAALRGDGCVCCPAMGETCRGLELEWWSEWEWSELQDHIAEG